MTTDARDLVPFPATHPAQKIPSTTDHADAAKDDPHATWRNLPSNPFPRDVSDRPDQRPLDWRPMIRPKAPPDPFVTKPCVVAAKPPKDPAPAPPQFRGPHPDNNRRGQIYERVGDPNDLSRAQYWTEFRQATVHTHDVHEALAAPVTSFVHAEYDKELRALMFVAPDHEGQNELDDYAGTQPVPTRGGVTVGSLFDENNQLVLSKQDRSSLDTLARDSQTGHGARVERADYDAVEADNRFKAAFSALKAAVLRSQSAAEGLVKAKNSLEAEVADEAARGEQAEIDRLKQEAAEVVEIVESLTSYITAIAQIATGNWGDGIEQVGMVAAKLMSHVNDGKIAAAEQRLANALDKKWTSRKLAAIADLNQARHALHATQEAVSSRQAGLRAEMTARRRAYNALGSAAATEIAGPKQTRDRVAGILAAIPIAEFVAARAAAISSSAVVPSYTEGAGRGFMMARTTGSPEALAFIETVGEIAHCRSYYGALERRWHRRVTQLHEIRNKIVGTRPGDQNKEEEDG